MWLRDRLEESRRTLERFMSSEELLREVEQSGQQMVEVLKRGGTIFSCGNGGSFCDAMHFAEELSGRFRKDRRALSGLCLSDGAALTCIANDYGYDAVFARGLEAHGRQGDAVVVISTSGNSPNILRAVECARAKGIRTIALLGKDGGKVRACADLAIVVPSSTTERIQEIHIQIIHLLIEFIERSLFPELYHDAD